MKRIYYEGTTMHRKDEFGQETITVYVSEWKVWLDKLSKKFNRKLKRNKFTQKEKRIILCAEHGGFIRSVRGESCAK